MSVLNSDSTKQVRACADNDKSVRAAAGDVVEIVSGVGPHDELSETVNEIIVDSKQFSPICVCTCNMLQI